VPTPSSWGFLRITIDSFAWIDAATCLVSSTFDVMQPALSAATAATPAVTRRRTTHARAALDPCAEALMAATLGRLT
jgi:hypothetical protein